MQRSRHGLLVIIFVGVIGVCLTLGIVIYSRVQTSFGNDFSLFFQTKEEVVGERVFHMQKEDLKQIKLLVNGQEQLHIFWDASQNKWRLDNQTSLPVDQSKLNNYIDNLLLYRFVGQVQDLQQKIQDYGLDYPTYELTLQDKRGMEEKLWIGGRVSESLASYAVSSTADDILHIVPNPAATILAEVRDFFLDSIFSINGENLRRLRLQIPQRNFDLIFEKSYTTNDWLLIAPTSWPVFKGEFEAYLRNLIFFGAVRYYTEDELRHIQFEDNRVVARLTLQNDDENEEAMAVYSDRFGNFYGKMTKHPYYILLPVSFQTIIYKPLNILLEAFPELPLFSEVESLSWSEDAEVHNYRLIGENWFSEQGILSSDEEERLEVWYNGLRQNTILSESTGLEEEKGSTYTIAIHAKENVFTEIRWQKLTDETAVVWQNGRNTHFIVRNPESIFK